MNEFTQKRYAKLGPRVVKAMEKRHFAAWYFDTADEAVNKAMELIPEGHVVSWGGSTSCVQTGLIARVKAERKVIDRDTAKTPDERTELMRQALLCDTFLSSANAVTEDGRLINVDCFNNRVAATLFGPRQVIFLVGLNKIVKTWEAAIERARNKAAPENAQRFSYSIPCVETGQCADCFNDDCICSSIVTIRGCRPAQRIKVLLVGQDLGF
jgi:hypothetical protein